MENYYYVYFEPIYSQGVGSFEMITSSISNVELFLNEFDKYIKYLETIDDDIENWEFYENVYVLENYKNNMCEFNAKCIYKKYFTGTNIQQNRKINFNMCTQNKISQKIKFDNVPKLNNVYVNYEFPPLEIEFKNFNILKKNYRTL